MRMIPLTKGLAAYVSDADYDRLSQFRWYASSSGRSGMVYARRHENGRPQYLHHAVAGKPEPGMCVDHINGNTLDNRRENLRLVTQAQNNRNKHGSVRSPAGYIGVTRQGRGYVARLSRKPNRIYLGYFATAELAAAAVAEYVAKEAAA